MEPIKKAELKQVDAVRALCKVGMAVLEDSNFSFGSFGRLGRQWEAKLVRNGEERQLTCLREGETVMLVVDDKETLVVYTNSEGEDYVLSEDDFPLEAFKAFIADFAYFIGLP